MPDLKVVKKIYQPSVLLNMRNMDEKDNKKQYRTALRAALMIYILK